MCKTIPVSLPGCVPLWLSVCCCCLEPTGHGDDLRLLKKMYFSCAFSAFATLLFIVVWQTHDRKGIRDLLM